MFGINKYIQYVLSLAVIIIISLACYFFVDIIGYKVVALILLLTVSIIAMLFEIFPVVVAAVASALIWNFFFIPPIFTFHIGDTEDSLMFLMYFVVALINAVLTSKIKSVEKSARDKEEKEKSIQLYNTLFNSLSHELKTPISAVLGAVDTIKENKHKLSEKNISDLITEIEIAGLRLNRQVENLLNMSRLESGLIKPRFDWCDINELIYSVIKNNTADLKGRTINFTADDKLPLFRVDRGLLEQAINNIVHNALQYTNEHCIISIAAKHYNEKCIITIEDNGPGFPENEMAHVFDKFYRLPKTLSGGTGLGLSIAKGFIEAHKGKIALQNIKTGGALFIIEIPLQSSLLNNMHSEQ